MASGEGNDGRQVAAIARAVAQSLVADVGPGVTAEVETALRAQPTSSPQRYFDPISLGSLIVSICGLAWTVYHDLKRKSSKPAIEVVERTIRVELQETELISDTDRDRILGMVVAEIRERVETPLDSSDRPPPPPAPEP